MICTKCFVKTNKVFVVSNYMNDYFVWNFHDKIVYRI